MLRRKAALLAGFAVLAAACSPPAAPKTDAAPPASATAPAVVETATPTAMPQKQVADAGAPAGTKVLFVRETRADCEGEGPMKCLQVRGSEADPWELIYTRIEGFKYEEGNAYELRVTEDPKAKVRYRLVEIISKKPK